TAGGMFTVHSSEDILAETLYRLRRSHPHAPGHMISQIHDRIVEQLDDRIVDFEIDGSFPGDDEHDAHVHAAALASGAKILLTADSDFLALPEKVLDGLTYEVHTPDYFFSLVNGAAPASVRSVARQ